MRTIALVSVFFVAACLRANPDYEAPITGPDDPVSTSSGPKVTDGGVTPSVDLAHAEPPHDLASPASLPDLAQGGGSVGNGVVCGMATCAAPQFCCAGLGDRSCADPGLASCVGGKRIECDGPEDCAGGKLCCGGLLGSSCADSCPIEATLCHTAADCDDGGDHCCPNPSGYRVCSKHSC